jgi:hypothetical protein
MWFQIELPQVTAILGDSAGRVDPSRNGVGGLRPGSGWRRPCQARKADKPHNRHNPASPAAPRGVGAPGRAVAAAWAVRLRTAPPGRWPIASRCRTTARRGARQSPRAVAARRRRPSRSVRCRRGSFASRKRNRRPQRAWAIQQNPRVSTRPVIGGRSGGFVKTHFIAAVGLVALTTLGVGAQQQPPPPAPTPAPAPAAGRGGGRGGAAIVSPEIAPDGASPSGCARRMHAKCS